MALFILNVGTNRNLVFFTLQPPYPDKDRGNLKNKRLGKP